MDSTLTSESKFSGITPKPKPRLSFWQIWNMSFGFFGIQFGWALQLANGSRIFQTLGANVGDIAILWIAAPVTGLLVQPIIGHMSDHTWNKLGRRRPYFTVGAIFASIALMIMPYSPAVWVAAGMLWILDASINISMEPFRAFVGDMLPPEQRNRGFAMQALFIGTGSVIASALPFILTNWFGIPNVDETAGSVPLSIKVSFILGAVIYFLAVMWTVIRTKEYPPEEMKAFQLHEQADSNNTHDPALDQPLDASVFLKHGPIVLVVGAGLTALTFLYIHHKEPLILTLGIALFGLMLIATGSMTRQGKTKNGFVEIINDIYKMPKTMGQLAWVQFFSWFGLFSMFIYTTPAVTSHIYGTSDTTSALYNKGADHVNLMFATYNFIAAIYALLLAPIASKITRKGTHALSLILGGLGLISIYFVKDPNVLFVSMIGVGIAWASILSMPYAMLTNCIPPWKFGIYMGIFNFFIVIPEITASSIYGFLLESFFNNEPIYVLMTGGVSLILAALLVTRVDDKE